MPRSTTLAALTTALLIAGSLAGCSLLASGPQRGDDGQVTESSTISARDLLDGDCFSHNPSVGDTVADVTVTPCSQEHDLIIIAQGSLSVQDITAAGSLQNAVSAACADTFTTFKAANTASEKPKLEFLVFPESDEADANQQYSCVSTDPGQSARSTS